MGALFKKSAKAITKISEIILSIELRVVGLFLGLILLFIVAGVTARYLRMPIYWIDELSVFTMVWLTFLGASAMTRLQLNFAITLLTDYMQGSVVKYIKFLAMLISALFGLALFAMSWIWLDPIGIIKAGFNAKEFAATSFNFLYTEYTQTLEWPRWAVMLVVPIFGINVFFHSLANVLEILGAVELPKRRIGAAEVSGAS